MLLILFGLGIAYAELRRFDDASRYIGEAMTAVETTKERWSRRRPIVSRRNRAEIAGAGCGENEAYFERARFASSGQNPGNSAQR